ncbi:ADP-ribosylglycohydrolase family protein [Natronospora cellulosivora (SeqCode)]
MINIKNRFAGALIGLAVGDALGTTLEFKARGSFEPLEDMVGGGPFDLEPGQWTDDTSMALCLAESLVEDGFDLDSQLAKYLKWFNDGYLSSTGTCFDIGNNTAKSLREYEGKGKLPDEYEYAAGNGALMRLAPVAMYYKGDFEKAVLYSGKSSITTHNNILSIDSCRCFGRMLQQAIVGKDKDSILTGEVRQLEVDDKVKLIADGSYMDKDIDAISSSGFVIDSLEASLWAFYHTENFKDAVLKAVNLGDDADTVGAITGQIAGAYYGLDGIPEEWVSKLAKKDLIFDLLDKLYNKIWSSLKKSL